MPANPRRRSARSSAPPQPLAAAPPVPPKPPIAILGVPIDDVSTDEAVELIARMLASRAPHYFATANVDFLVQAQRDAELHRILLEADLVVCDGIPVRWAARRLGNPLRERVAGADLVPRLLQVATQRGFRVFLLGAAAGSAAAAIARLEQEYPGLVIAGHYSPPFAPLLEMDHDDIVRRVRAARPDLLLVAFGCPKQEKWIAMHYRFLGVPVSAGIGATVDFLSGRVRRAPPWMQHAGLEWAFRLVQEPRRLFARYLRDFRVFGVRLAAQHRQLGRPASRQRDMALAAGVADIDELQLIRVPAQLDAATLGRDPLLQGEALAVGRHCLLDLSQVRSIDSTGVGFLIRLRRLVRATDRELVLLAPGAAVQRALRLMHLVEAFAVAPDLAAARGLIEHRVRERASPACDAGTPGFFAWRGEVTADNAAAVWERTKSHIEAAAGGADGVLIDLSALRFVDSSGLRVMLRARTAAQRLGTTLAFQMPPPAVRQVARVAGIEQLLFENAERTHVRPV